MRPERGPGTNQGPVCFESKHAEKKSMGRILVVDDDKDILRLVEQVLAEVGHIVVTATSVLEAVDHLRHASFDMVLSDANMPMHSGFDLVATLRKDPQWQNLSIAMITGRREKKDIEKALQAGVDDYIVKPIDPLLLIQKVETLFNKRPPESHPVWQVNSLEQEAGKVIFPMHLRKISELGVTATSAVAFTYGQTIEVKFQFFTDLRLEPPPLRVLRCHEIGPGEYEVELIFLGAREAFLQQIRRWIYSHAGSARSAS